MYEMYLFLIFNDLSISFYHTICKKKTLNRSDL